MPAHSKNDLAFLSIEQVAPLLRRRKISPVELVEAALARIERLNPAINAFITVVGDRARRQGRAAEKQIRQGRASSLLCGIPISIKDNFWARGVRTTAGSMVLADFVPAKDSAVAEKLASAGAILLGKTNMHEFAYGITNDNPHYGAAHNPWDLERITGGSSGGSAAALAAGIGYGATGTDTGGSIRIPAALCGVAGIKPTFGLVSVEGVIPLAETFDHAGPIARNVGDTCVLLEAIADRYPKGATPPDYRKLRKSRRQPFRLGWPKEYFFDRVDDELLKLFEGAAIVFRSMGIRVEEVSLKLPGESAEPSTNIALAEARHYHESQGYYPARATDYGED